MKAVSPLMAPGVRWMIHLQLSGKAALLAIAFLIPVGMIVFGLYSIGTEATHFAHRERIGVSYLRLLQPVAAAVVSSDSATVSSALAPLVTQQHADGDALQLDAAITALQAAASERAPREVMATRLMELFGAVADNSNLTLDPDLDTYYLMALTTDALPRWLLTASETADGNAAEQYGRMTVRTDAVATAVTRAIAARASLQALLPAQPVLAVAPALRGGAVLSSAAMVGVAETLHAAAVTQLDQLLLNRITAQQQRLLRIGLWSLVLLMPGVYLLHAFYLANNRGFDAMVTRMRSLAEGDLTLSYPAKGTDEISVMINTLNASRQRLQELINKTRASADALDRVGRNVGNVSNQLRQEGDGQLAAVQRTASNVKEISEKSRLNLDNALQANRHAQLAHEVASRGDEVMRQVVATMQNISSSSRKIGDIIGVINEIAFQTNLLALNAAVEAARAGEQGRGFAVVAAEVRNLAQRSAQAANEIRQLITASLQDVSMGGQLVDAAGQTMQEVLVSFRQVSNLVGDISASSQHQERDVAQLTHAIGDIEGAAGRNLTLVLETMAAVQALEQEVINLLDSVDMFTFNGNLMSDGLPASALTPAVSVMNDAGERAA